MLANVLLYSMWGDPWGGWAFGSRYLIPSYALMSALLALALNKYARNWLFMSTFILMLVYSLSVNSLGAITTSAVPHKGEAQALEKISHRQEKYSYDRNYEYLTGGGSKSFVFQTYAKNYIEAKEYYYIFNGVLIANSLLLCAILVKKHDQIN